VRIGPNNVRLGIDAPRDLNIVREELVSNEPVLNQSQGTSESSVRP
jgi:sRNA-binding carbon storage regulator CsrA